MNMCNHWIVFHEVREIGPNDVKDVEQYKKGIDLY